MSMSGLDLDGLDGGPASPGSLQGLKRMKGVISRGIVHGTVAFTLAGVKGDDATHKWTCYVRGPDDYEISPFIKQVAFHLHPSFASPTRTFKSPPYEVHEQGWGEFDIAIKIHFTPDANLRPIEIHHTLKLYPNADSSQVPSKVPVLNEIYEELVFTDPEPSFVKRLKTRARGAGDTSALEKYHPDIQSVFRPFDGNEHQRQIKRVRHVAAVIMEETEDARTRLKSLDAEIGHLKQQISTGNWTSSAPKPVATTSGSMPPPAAQAGSPKAAAAAAAGVKQEISPRGRPAGKRKSK